MMKAKILTGLLAGFILAACASIGGFFGEIETGEQRAYRLAVIYGYLAIPTHKCVQQSVCSGDVAAEIVRAEQSFHSAYKAARASFAEGGGSLDAALNAAADGLTTFSVVSVGLEAVPDSPADLASKGIRAAALAATSAAEMRVWRNRGKAELEAMRGAGVNPTEVQWAAIDAVVEGWHAAIQGTAPPS